MASKRTEKKKKPIPLIISGVGYVTTAGYVKYCTSGHDSERKPIPRPKDFKKWDRPIKRTQKIFVKGAQTPVTPKQ